MKFPCELLAEPYIAQLRINIAHNLKVKNYTQTEIASLLQVSQPVVSGYLKKSRHNSELPQIILSRAREVADDITTILHQQGINGTEQAISRGCYECKVMRQAGPTCIYHRGVTSELGEDCTSCLTEKPLLQIQENKQGVIMDLHDLFNFIVRLKHLDRIIPEVGMQIIHSITEPESMSDIAAFPGRIIKRKGRNPIADTPTFGGSETTSQLLLDLYAQDIGVRTIAAVKTTGWLTQRLDHRDYTWHQISGFEEDMHEKISEITVGQAPFAIVGIDSIGFESITYICARDTSELKEIFEDLIG